jgi:hypothetical protein
MREEFRSDRLGIALLIGCLGLLVYFGAQKADARPKPEALPANVRLLPDRAFRVEWEPIRASPFWKPGQIEIIPVTFTNASKTVWPNFKTARGKLPGEYAVRVSYRWLDANAKMPGNFGERFELPKPVNPGEAVTVAVRVQAPTMPGSYQLQFDLVQELVAWFADKGAKQLRFPVRVEP